MGNFIANASPDYRFGFNGMLRDDDVRDEKLTSVNEGRGNSYSTEYRFYDNRAGRWLSIDPLASKFPWSSPYVAMGNNPVIMVDILGDSAFVFDNDLKYVNSIDNGKDNWEINVLHKNGEQISTQIFQFNDPENDPNRMKNLIVKYSNSKQFLFYKSEEDERNYLKSVGLSRPWDDSFYSINLTVGSLVLAFNSSYDFSKDKGLLDFWGSRLIPELKKSLGKEVNLQDQGAFFITGKKAYNDMDYGNRLWGKSTGYMRLPLWYVKTAADIHNRFKHNGKSDDPADQQAIEDGWRSVK